MAFEDLTFYQGEVLTASKLNQIVQNVRDHVHGKDGVTERAAKIIIQPDSDPASGTKLFEIRDAAGSTLISGDIDGKLSASQLESTVASGTPPLIIASTDMVSNLNAEYWSGKLPSDLILEGPSPDPSYLSWDSAAFYSNTNGTSQDTGGSWVQVLSTTFTLDSVLKQFLKIRFLLASSTGETVRASVQISNPSGQLIGGAYTVSETSTTLTEHIVYPPSLVASTTSNAASWNDTITIELYVLSPSGTQVSWDDFYAYFVREALVTGRWA